MRVPVLLTVGHTTLGSDFVHKQLLPQLTNHGHGWLLLRRILLQC